MRRSSTAQLDRAPAIVDTGPRALGDRIILTRRRRSSAGGRDNFTGWSLDLISSYRLKPLLDRWWPVERANSNHCAVEAHGREY
jgi:hypothetical protein